MDPGIATIATLISDHSELHMHKLLHSNDMEGLEIATIATPQTGHFEQPMYRSSYSKDMEDLEIATIVILVNNQQLLKICISLH